MTDGLRDWQRDALGRLIERRRPSFLAVATPGAGKTTFALEAAARLRVDDIERIVVVVPSNHLRRQWAKAALRVGIQLNHTFVNRDTVLARDFDGAVVTYSTVDKQPDLWRTFCAGARTLVILDEVHRSGEADDLRWGPSLHRAFDHAARRILLSGTPFRSDGHPIPFVTYDDTGRCVPDFNYDYGEALRDGGVVRPVEFLALNSEVQWRHAGAVVETTLDAAPDSIVAAALNVALRPHGDWIPSVLLKADEELTRQRLDMPDAGGLVVASNQDDARDYAEQLTRLTGCAAVVAVSDDPDASHKITRFDAGTDRWLVAVNMVSEGVDIPRLRVGVYATNTRTERFVRQVVGRFVRQRRPDDSSSATLFMPSIQKLLAIAAGIERTVDDALSEAVEREGREGKTSSAGQSFTVVSSTEATHHSTITRGEAFSDSELQAAERLVVAAQMERATPAEVARLLRLARIPHAVGTVQLNPDVKPLADQKKRHADQVHRLVGRYNRTKGIPYSHINGQLNKACGIKRRSEATMDDLRKMIDLLSDWIEGSP